MRLIDADKLIESICYTAGLGGWIGDTLLQIQKLAIKYINSAPSIDIVRCGECKHTRTEDCPVCNECGRKAYPTADDDFCSYGERNSSEKPTGSTTKDCSVVEERSSE